MRKGSGYGECKINECTGKGITFGWCNKHYIRFYQFGDPNYVTPISHLTTSPENKKLFVTWSSMRRRCNNMKDKQFPGYGGRGIQVCDRWLGKDGFKNFIEDMGYKPTPEHSIERINNDGNYEPGNCKWATRLEQEFNKGMQKNNTTGVKGVAYIKKSKIYYATVTVNRKTIYLGSYRTVAEASIARQAGEYKYYGRYVT